MSHLIIRLGPDDLVAYDAAMRVFADAFETPEQYTRNRPQDDYIKALLARPGFYLLVAKKAEKIVGALAAYEWDKFERQTREIYIYDLAVATNDRRQGIGGAMLEEMQSLAKTRKASALMIQADADDPPANALYRAFAKPHSIQHYELKPKHR